MGLITKSLVAVALTSAAVVTTIMLTGHSPAPNILSINPVVLTNCELQPVQFSNSGAWHKTGTNYQLFVTSAGMSGSIFFNSFTGASMEVSWFTTATNSYKLGMSTDLFHWEEVPVLFVGDGDRQRWLDDGLSPHKYFRLQIQ